MRRVLSRSRRRSSRQWRPSAVAKAPALGLAALSAARRALPDLRHGLRRSVRAPLGALGAVVAEVVEKFLAWHSGARVRPGARSGCRHEYLPAFSCKCRYLCPSSHAKRSALWLLWLEETLPAPVAHRQVVLAVPKRLRPYLLYNRGLLGDLSRVAARTLTAFIRATTGERKLSIGIVASIHTHGSLVSRVGPSLDPRVGGFRAARGLVPSPARAGSPTRMRGRPPARPPEPAPRQQAEPTPSSEIRRPAAGCRARSDRVQGKPVDQEHPNRFDRFRHSP
jgi:hypothetical protein